MDFLDLNMRSRQPGRIARLTGNIVRKLQRRNTVLDVHVKDVVKFLAFIQLFSALADCIDNIPDLLPGERSSVPLG